ncbi:hypothetical protein IDAT_02735 [Pseudidiomarina atlantica]|uniref:Uncharacterized protein n=1 Tax=Pseudidiomarina atlantica TaxID=1517416 RepID=A0A094IQP5_9GAMM|nr:CsiV family protein [Pseudidiomarina atlantica]KFZ30015.1 hypothetical protein IDAT_02735 [Pseudidiomarina atlantica]
MTQGWYRKPIATAALAGWLAVSSFTQVAKAQQLPEQDLWRWFEVEVLVFAHRDAGDTVESFPWQGPQRYQDYVYNPLPSVFVPDITALLADLPECATPTVIPEFNRERLLCAAPWELDPWLPMNWQRQERMLRELAAAPADVINGPGGEVKNAAAPFLAPASQLELSETRQQLVRRGTGTPLLHLSWYQPVFGADDEYKVRLFGGRNFADEFSLAGYALPDEQAKLTALSTSEEKPELGLAERLQQLAELQRTAQFNFSAAAKDEPLAAPSASQLETPTTPLWQLDGTMHIYLVGNYLHIDSDLELREPTAVDWQPADLTAQADLALEPLTNKRFLRSFKLDQLRRVISHETHYFDHPKLGVVVQIRRTDLSARRY